MSTEDLTILHLEKPFPGWEPGRGEGVQVHSAVGLFVLAYNNLCEHDVADFQERGRFGFLRVNGRVVFTIDFGPRFRLAVPYIGDPTCDCCAMERTEPGEHRLLSFALVDATTGTIVGLRTSTISAHVSEKLQNAVDAQPPHVLSTNEHDHVIKTLDRGYPRWADINRDATTSRLGA